MDRPPRNNYQFEKVPAPKGLSDLPRYLKELLGGFFSRFSYIVKLVWKTGPWILILKSFISLFQGITPIIGALLTKDILNRLQYAVKSGGLTENDFWSSEVFVLLLFLFSYRLLKRAITTVNGSLNRISGELIVREVKLQIMRKSKELDLASYDLPSLYEKLENANREAGTRPISIITQTFDIISTVIEFASYIAVLAAAPNLGWSVPVIIAVSVPSAVINFIYRRKNFNYVCRRSKDRRQMNYCSDVLVNKDIVKEVRMYDIADTFIGKFITVFNGYYGGLRKLILNEGVWHIVIGVIACATNLLLYALIALQVWNGSMLIGDYTLYTGALVSIATCVNTLITTSAAIYEGTLFIDNLIVFMKEKKTVAPQKNPPKQVQYGVKHTIEFVDVSFRYPGTERDILKHINLKFNPGETVVLVGLNGAGKTTLIKLLTRLYDPTDGAILLDGVDLRDYDVQGLYKMFGIIFQDFGKYAVSVSENIQFGDIHKPYDISNIKKAALQSNAAQYIDNLAEGYDTPLMRMFEPTGTELSGGQWQKLAVARAFYADSDVLILDEPTAALDAIAEQEIFNQFDSLRSEKTTVFVSHRLSSATVASLIVVLENGRVIEQGTHRELMKKQGKYYELFTIQASRYECDDCEPLKVPCDNLSHTD